MKSFLTFFLTGLLPWCVVAKNSTVSVRTLQLIGGEMPKAWVMVEGENEPVELTWSGTQPTLPLKVVYEDSLKLLHYVEDAKGEKSLEVLHTVNLPASAREILLLGAANDGVGKYLAIEDRFMEAKFDDWMAINISNQTVALKAGDKGKPVTIEAGKSVIFRPDIEEGTGVKIMAVSPRKGKWKPFYSTYWPAFSGQRTMIIFYRDGERMRARRIGDRFIRPE